MRFPWANTVLLILLIVQLLTGFLGLISGSPRLDWFLQFHSVFGYAIAGLLIWKSAIILDVFTRRHRRWLTASRAGFIVLLTLLLGLLTTSLIWTYAGPIYVAGFSLMTVHALLALVLVLFLIWHVVAKWFVLRIPEARDRRALLRLVGASVAGLVLWQSAEKVKAAVDLKGAVRRFTGSYETGSFTGNFPVVSWLFDYPRPVERDEWRLVIDGAVEQRVELTYDKLQQLAGDTATETLDCTGGWYSIQEWTGINVGRLLEMAGVQETAASVTVEAVSGYGRRFGIDEIRAYLLAMQVAGETLEHGHGFPARLVASGHRGFDWVKWVSRIRVNETSKFWQPPVPLQ